MSGVFALEFVYMFACMYVCMSECVHVCTCLRAFQCMSLARDDFHVFGLFAQRCFTQLLQCITVLVSDLVCLILLGIQVPYGDSTKTHK